VTYDDSSRTVTWTVGDLGAGASAQAAFQVGLTASASQRGTSPVLVNAPTISGVDRFAQVTVSGSGSAVTTDVTKDPAYKPADADVQ
jgi:hypothetical protein